MAGIGSGEVEGGPESLLWFPKTSFRHSYLYYDSKDFIPALFSILCLSGRHSRPFIHSMPLRTSFPPFSTCYASQEGGGRGAGEGWGRDGGGMKGRRDLDKNMKNLKINKYD